jgi:hypothetical protein
MKIFVGETVQHAKAALTVLQSPWGYMASGLLVISHESLEIMHTSRNFYKMLHILTTRNMDTI